MTAVADRIRALSQRYGRRSLVALALIAALGLLVRAYVVVNPVENPADDSRAYFALAKGLYEEGSYGGLLRDASDWSPGAPLLYAAAFFVTGGAREGTARIVEALCGLGAILVAFALGWRLAESPRRRRDGPPEDGAAAAGYAPSPSWVTPATGLLAALAVAVYPPFIHSTGELMSEPPAILTLPAAVLTFLWAGDRTAGASPGAGHLGARRQWPWLIPGLLLGLTAMFRPEYLLVGIAFVVLAASRPSFSAGGTERRKRRREWRLALAGAAILLAGIAVVIAPWAIRNQIVLDRTVPISTGGGKALYVGTFLPADGEYQRVKARLARRYLGRDLRPGSAALDAVEPTPLFDRVADRYPDLPRDQALGRIGRENFSKFFGEDPLGYLAMTVRKVGRMWSSGVGEAMGTTLGRVLQLLIVALGLGGAVLLGLRRHWWDLVALAAPIVLVTAVGAASLAAPRRNEVLMMLVFPLAALALSSGAAAILSGRR